MGFYGSSNGEREQFRDRLLKERLDNPKAHHKGDFLDNIIAAKNEDGTSITIEEVKTEGLVLMVAASDTTAAFFCGFVRLVLQTPGVYDKLIAEIDDFDRQGLLASPVPTFEQIKQMSYFVACHRETLRYQPSTPIIIPRRVSAGGLHLYDKFAPEGTEIGANPYVIQRDKGVFGEDADFFRPERWLEDPEKEKEMDRYILTWGYGTRICLGKNIAQLETYKLMVQVLITPKYQPVRLADTWLL